jgi:hypothetical protein
MTKREKFLLLCGLILYFVLVTWSTLRGCSAYSGVRKSGSVAVVVFYDLQFGGALQSIVVASAMLLTYSVIGSIFYIYVKNNRSFYNVHQRIGYRRFLQNGTLSAFFYAAVLAIVTSVYEMVLISVTFYKFNFYTKDTAFIAEGSKHFSQNTLIDLTTFVVLSAIGWGVYSVFIFSIGLFIKKTSIFVVLGVIVGTGLILLSGMANLGLGGKLASFFYVWFLPVLISPGKMSFGAYLPPVNILLAFWIAVLVYLAISWLIMRLWLKQMRWRS